MPNARRMIVANLFNPPKKVICSFVGVDGNAFAIMAHFKACAKKQGWTEEEAKRVTNEATSSDYNHLIYTFLEHTKEPEDAE